VRSEAVSQSDPPGLIMPRSAPSPDATGVYAVIPIAVLSSAMPARHRERHSSAHPKTFTITLELCSRPPGIRVHDALETVITMLRNMQPVNPFRRLAIENVSYEGGIGPLYGDWLPENLTISGSKVSLIWRKSH
jgi:hypothetical protein